VFVTHSGEGGAAHPVPYRPALSELLFRPAGWVLRAACLTIEDPDIFFPNGERGRALSQLEEARKVCDACPVRSECLALALGCDERHGMWGGTTPDERVAIRRGPIARVLDGLKPDAIAVEWS
jgi:WhiB family redox-sensing transcriptional regulator